MALFDFLFGRKDRPQGTPTKKVHPVNNALLSPVEVLPGIVLPKALANHWPEIEQTKRLFIAIKATPAELLTLRQSKFFDVPCIPKGFAYPVDGTAQYMIPLAQINCSECPKFAGFPETGYLQFYIATDDMYGIDFDDQQTQKGFRVLFFEEHELTDPETDFSFLADTMQTEYTPVPRSYSLTFTLQEEYVGMQDYQGNNHDGSITESIVDRYPALQEPLIDALYTNFPGSGHKMGGYAYFTQEAPRLSHEEWREHLLLFQLDSDNDIMWGDVGVANFFIHPDDLARKDFTKVIYNWDCH